MNKDLVKQKKSYTVWEIREKVANYCVYQDRCHAEVERKLKEFRLSQEIEDEIIIYLIQNDFLNEERYAKSFVRGRFNQKKWGRNKISIYLKRNNIQDNLIKIALKEIDEKDYQIIMNELIAKKYNELKSDNNFTKYSKTLKYMLQKGYEYELIRDAMN